MGRSIGIRTPRMNSLFEFRGRKLQVVPATEDCEGCQLYAYCRAGIDVKVNCEGEYRKDQTSIILIEPKNNSHEA